MAEQPATSASTNRWSAKVTRESNALSLEKGVFTWKDPKAIAQSLAFGATTSLRANQFSFFDSIRVGKKQMT